MPVYGLAECSVALAVPAARARAARRPRRARALRARGRRGAGAGGRCRRARGSSPAGGRSPGTRSASSTSTGRELPRSRRGTARVPRPVGDQRLFPQPARRRARCCTTAGWTRRPRLLADGELLITGREKDLIISGGRNLYPQEIEEAVGDIPGIRKGCVAAFGVPRSGERHRAPGGAWRRRAQTRRGAARGACGGRDRVASVAALGAAARTMSCWRRRAPCSRPRAARSGARATREAYVARHTRAAAVDAGPMAPGCSAGDLRARAGPRGSTGERDPRFSRSTSPPCWDSPALPILWLRSC